MAQPTLCCSSPTGLSNLDRFLQCVTPVVPSHPLPRSCTEDLNSLWFPPSEDTIEYFTLKDLWNCYHELSAFGVGTPVMLENDETVMQYYVPYLSAIQLYTDKSVAASRNRREDVDTIEFESDSWSDDSASDNLSRSLSNNSSKTWDLVSEDSSCDQDGAWPTRDKLGSLCLDLTERSSPYCRVPLTDKITELSINHPALMTLKSVDLSPASWMAVAWYPIYTIPSRKNERDLATCFLTYHTLSSSFLDCTMEFDGSVEVGKDKCCSDVEGGTEEAKSKQGSRRSTRLAPFGLATYKLQGDLWLLPDSFDHERIVHLYNAADSWLKQLNVHHHDFNYFTFHSSL